ncbi:porphobilinogen deaminase [Legionella lansingensis]|uniref:Porphobilinogen deaminase n=1 Tax=Legionella lansingensis TaxID=45067 RepID=A0A0W0VPM9_9GAMM|nr:hydroxymethylbilane synthase [Legionella lansingensis]KTD22062.1 porphobilinogen deaminase [Legionella lansingensis]SNV54208.1 porphobilinogen deaminase [Legionella lansingensis]
MTIETIRIATRKSPLALWQANFIAGKIKEFHPAIRIELVPMVTSGDKFQKDKLQAIGGKGLFVKELEEALLDKRADIAVHSMKDVPATFPGGLCLNVISERHKPSDTLISKDHKKLQELPKGAVIGTTSLRRQSQLLAFRPDLAIKPLRGNVNTRLEKLNNGEYDAIVLALAGLERLGMEAVISEILSEEVMIPACGQGALGIECREDDVALQQLLATVNDPLSSLCVRAERHVNALLGGNCHVPLAVYCKPLDKQDVFLRARVLSLDGKTVIEDSQRGSQSEAMLLADHCVQALLAKGAKKLLCES